MLDYVFKPNLAVKEFVSEVARARAERRNAQNYWKQLRKELREEKAQANKEAALLRRASKPDKPYSSVVYTSRSTGQSYNEETCEDCLGTGFCNSSICKKCKGYGLLFWWSE